MSWGPNQRIRNQLGWGERCTVAGKHSTTVRIANKVNGNEAVATVPRGGSGKGSKEARGHSWRLEVLGKIRAGVVVTERISKGKS